MEILMNKYQTPITEELISQYPEEVIEQLYDCINNDDVLLKHLQYELSIKVVWVKNNKQHPTRNRFCYFFSKPLSTFNVVNNGNDYYLKKFKCYE